MEILLEDMKTWWVAYTTVGLEDNRSGLREGTARRESLLSFNEPVNHTYYFHPDIQLARC